MDVLCLNGTSVTVQPLETLQEAKVKVAKALGAFPEALWISCGGQILSGETVEICLAKLELDSQPPALFAVVDQNRQEMARHLRIFEPEAVAFQKKVHENEQLSAKFARKQKELATFGSQNIRWIETQLKEGNVSLQKEKALVARLPKLRMLQKLEDELYEETDKLHGLRSRLRAKLAQVRSDLQTALKNHDHDNDELLAEFDELARAREPQSVTFNFDSDASSYISWWDSEELSRQIANPKIEELTDSCPRLLRREAWCNSKRSWKYIPKTAPPLGEKYDLLEQPQGGDPRKDSRRRQISCRRAISRDLKSQLQEYSS